ncbi:MAG: HDOD domain-containing protein [Planctomycetota bacterium]
MPALTSSTLETFIQRAGRLYSPPAVALEIVRLTAEPQVDATAIRNCLAGDPALAVKLLRVVNSSIYGLKGEVADLTQAVALVGVRPLKLLVLGFSLPDDLLASVDPDTLVGYWTRSITRSILARQIAAEHAVDPAWKNVADEALVAGLLEGVGQLLLLSELGPSYAAVVDAAEKSSDESLAAAETRALGFDHRSLSAGLLRSWNLPARIAEAIENQASTTPARRDDPLAATLELADLATGLIVDRRLNALPKLLDRGDKLCGLTRRDVQQLLEAVQPKTDQLAEALGVELRRDVDFVETLAEAQRQLADVAEGAAARLLGAEPDPEDAADERLCRELLEDVNGLTGTMKEYLEAEAAPAARPTPKPGQQHGPRGAVRAPHHSGIEAAERQLEALTSQHAEACRGDRSSLSIAIVELEQDDPQALAGFRRWWKTREDAGVASGWVALSTQRLGVLMPGMERRDAVRVWNEAVEAYAAFQGGIDVGVAGVALVSKGFYAGSLIEPATRCLDAAIAAGAPTVKSIEVY